MDISGSLHELHLGYEGSVFSSLPGGSAGDLLTGVLYIPAAIVRGLEFLAVNFGSAISDDWDV